LKAEPTSLAAATRGHFNLKQARRLPVASAVISAGDRKFSRLRRKLNSDGYLLINDF
jgi:hypothetical protein